MDTNPALAKFESLNFSKLSEIKKNEEKIFLT